MNKVLTNAAANFTSGEGEIDALQQLRVALNLARRELGADQLLPRRRRFAVTRRLGLASLRPLGRKETGHTEGYPDEYR